MFWKKKEEVVSKVSYDNMYALALKLQQELTALKASRARSNENLKLGTAASAKARRKKVAPAEKCGLDFSRPVVAFHVDGREIKITDLKYDQEVAWSRQIPGMEYTYFNSVNGKADGTGWALRYA